MKKLLLTDVELRARWYRDRSTTYYVEEGTMLTPAARDFIKEHRIQICYTPIGVQADPVPASPVAGVLPPIGAADRVPAPATASMTTTPIPTVNGKARYRNAVTGEEMAEKPEEMTHLRGNLLVPKIHPRIEFRGMLDSLMAKILEVQILAQEQGDKQVLTDLEDVLRYTRKILSAEVKDETLPEVTLLGMSSEELRYASHHVKKVFGIDHPIPSYEMGRLVVALNSLRAQVREVELSAARAFCQNGAFTRVDVIQGLNRMSSAVYIILCRKLSGNQDRTGKEENQ